MKVYKLKQTLQGQDVYQGKFCYFIKQSAIKKYTDQFYPNRTLKIFKGKFTNLKTFEWGLNLEGYSHNLYNSTIIQNMYADDGLAPRVWDLVLVDDGLNKNIAQVTEEAGGHREEGRVMVQKFIDLKLPQMSYINHIKIHSDPQPGNVVGNQYVDFQNFSFKDFDFYRKELIQDWTKNTIWKIEGPYQDYTEFGIKGRRNIKHRLDILKIEPKDKVVVDIGCSGGAFVNWSAQNGAEASFGFDIQHVIKYNSKLANIAGIFNVSYLSNIREIPKADIVLFLSMHRHVGYPDWVHDKVKDVLYFEGNHDFRDKYEKFLKTKFHEVKFLGNATDFQIRPNFYCKGPK